MADAVDVSTLRWRIEVLEQALQTIASPLLEVDVDEIREEARAALRISRAQNTRPNQAVAPGHNGGSEQ